MVIRPSLGVAVSRAAAIANAINAEAGLAALEQIDADDVGQFQPFWATRAHLLAESGNAGAELVIEAYEKAISLSDNEVVRKWLRERLAAASMK
jgi:RNA polymerase sigma-70 factor (ECF subfamily)